MFVTKCFADYSPDGLRLTALNRFRIGELSRGLGYMDLQLPKDMAEEIMIPDYHTDRDQFYVEMEALAELFEKKGL